MPIKLILSTLSLSVALAAPAYAQIGGVVSGTVDTTVGGTVSSTVNTTSRVKIDKPDTPDVRVKAPTRLDVDAPTSAKIRAGTYSGGHYHGGHYHNHGYYAHDHFHDHQNAHTHGYAKVVVTVDNTQSQAIGPLLTYGTQVFSRKDKDLGQINGLTRSSSGVITHVMVSAVPRAIPVDTLRADGDVLITSKKKKHLK